MNALRRAPWYIKALLFLLPAIALLRIYPTAQGIGTLLSLKAAAISIGLAVAAEVLVLVYLWVAAWFIWHPRPFARWLVLGVFALAIANSIWYELHPSQSGIQLPRVAVDESRPSYHVGTFVAQALALWWAYLCVFGSRSVQFFGGSLR
jgi:hypothetical protein